MQFFVSPAGGLPRPIGRRQPTQPARAKAGRRDQREVSPAGSVRVRFWKPTGLPFIAEPVRFANRPGQRSQSQPKGGLPPTAVGGLPAGASPQSGVFTARQGANRNKPFGCAAQPRLSGGGDFGFRFGGRGFPLESLSVLRFVSPIVRRFPRATGGKSK